jgi:hypothetical protein
MATNYVYNLTVKVEAIIYGLILRLIFEDKVNSYF